MLLCSCFCTCLVWRFCLFVWAAVSSLIAVSWLVIWPQPLQELRFRCELASANCHCGDADIVSIVHGICFLRGILVGTPFTPCLAVVFGNSSTTPQFPATATSRQRCHHSRLMALPDVELSISLSLKVRTCGTIACAWDTHCGVPSSPHLTEMFMRNFGLTTPLSFWLDRAAGLLMPCADGCFAGFAAEDMATNSPFWNTILLRFFLRCFWQTVTAKVAVSDGRDELTIDPPGTILGLAVAHLKYSDA